MAQINLCGFILSDNTPQKQTNVSFLVITIDQIVISQEKSLSNAQLKAKELKEENPEMLFGILKSIL